MEQLLTPEVFFSGKPLPEKLFLAIRAEVEALGGTSIRVTRSEIAFRRRRAFAWVWMPDRYLKGRTAPVVLTIALPWRDSSPRWKEIVEPAPGRFTHHLELYDLAGIDEEVRGWLRAAWEAAA